MPKKLVIMSSKEGREALRGCGVLPPSVFKRFGEMDDGDFASRGHAGAAVHGEDAERAPGENAASLGFHVWPYDPDNKCASPGFGDFPLLSMLGMEPPKNNAEYLERKIAATKLLGSTILHVILLDEFDLGAKAQKPSPCLMEPFVKWCDTLQAGILREYSEEQATGLEHVFILVARNPGGLKVDGKDIQSFCRRLNHAGKSPPDVARIRTCFFLDRAIEIELGDDLFPSGLIWAQMVGRLLLRMLVGFESCPEDPVGWCDGGIRLWKASEFVLDFQPERVHALMSAGINAFVEQLRTGNLHAGTALSIHPWKPSVDRVVGTVPAWRFRDEGLPWNEFPAENCKREAFDDGRWREVSRPPDAGGGKDASNPKADAGRDGNDAGLHAHAGGVDSERTRLANEIHGAMTSADEVRVAVSGWVDEASREVRAYFSPDAGTGVSGYWEKIVQLCLRRARCKDVLDGVVGDYELAKDHYVQKKHCLLAVVAVSLCAGLAFSRFACVFGGGLVLALLLCAGTFAGGLAAMKLMLFLHDRCGRLFRSALLGLCGTADRCVLERDKCARDQIRRAVEIRARMLQIAKMRHFNRMVSRLQGMISAELAAPPAEVFIEDDLPEQSADDRASEVLKQQYDRFFKETNCRIGFEDRGEETARVRVSFPEECESVKTAWSALCARHDPRSAANFPARYFVPFLKRTLKNFQNRYRPEVWRSLTEDSFDDLIAKFRQPAMDQGNAFELVRRIRRFIADDACCSAHVDHENRIGIDVGAEFHYAPMFDDARWSGIKNLWAGLGVNDCPSRLLLGRTPHFALLFSQSQVDFTVKGERLVLRVASEREEEENV